MKKRIALILALSLALSLAACGDTDESSKKPKKDTSSSQNDSTYDESSSEAQTEATTTSAPEETTNETTTTQAEPEVKAADYTNILGEWYIDGDAAAAHLDIHSDGSFDSYYASGSLEYSGNIKYLMADLDDGTGDAYYFCFFADSETPLFYILDEGKELTEFTTKGPSLLHFARLKEAEPESDEFTMPEGMPYNYYTTFGAGATSGMDFHVSENGSFEGLYISYTIDEKNNNVVNYSHFAGSFKNAGKDQGGYDTFEVVDVMGIVGIPDKSSAFYNYVNESMTDVSESYGAIGITAGEIFHFYPQGAELDSLPQDFSSHVGFFNDSDDVLTENCLFGESSITILANQ